MTVTVLRLVAASGSALARHGRDRKASPRIKRESQHHVSWLSPLRLFRLFGYEWFGAGTKAAVQARLTDGVTPGRVQTCVPVSVPPDAVIVPLYSPLALSPRKLHCEVKCNWPFSSIAPEAISLPTTRVPSKLNSGGANQAFPPSMIRSSGVRKMSRVVGNFPQTYAPRNFPCTGCASAFTAPRDTIADAMKLAVRMLVIRFQIATKGLGWQLQAIPDSSAGLV